MKKVAFVFARGGSKGVKRKNIRKLKDKPLIYYSIEICSRISGINDIFVSTDSSEISEIAENYGAKIIFRPPELASDNSPELLSWKHAIQHVKENHYDFDIFLSLPTTSPLRNLHDINSCIKSLDSKTDMVVSMSESSKSPFFNMVTKANDGTIEILINQGEKFNNRQQAPKTYDLTTVAYVSRPKYILNTKNIFDGKVKGIEIPAIRALDIDTELDFEFAQFILERHSK